MRVFAGRCLGLVYLLALMTLLGMFSSPAVDRQLLAAQALINGTTSQMQGPTTTTKMSTSVSNAAVIEKAAMEDPRLSVLRLHLQSTTHTSFSPTDANFGLFPDELLADGTIDDDRIMKQIEFKSNDGHEEIYRIYVSGAAAFGVSYGRREFERKQCAQSNCEIVSRASTAHALIFRHKIDMTRTTLTPQSQLWVFYSLESPAYTRSLARFDAMVNYTATYRWDSDLVTPYERWSKNAQSTKPKSTNNYAEGKSKSIAWFVSHCITNSGRERYVKQLKRYINVDTFGRCGKMRCAKGSRQCDAMLETDYFFYLAFENSLCDDYITEKYFRTALMNNVVPIVMGASLEQYTRASPPHSFIHVDQFHSVAALANHLVYLQGNRTAYNEYFAWKGEYSLTDTKFWCRLCAMVASPRHKVYTRLDDWWRGGAMTCNTSHVYW